MVAATPPAIGVTPRASANADRWSGGTRRAGTDRCRAAQIGGIRGRLSRGKMFIHRMPSRRRHAALLAPASHVALLIAATLAGGPGVRSAAAQSSAFSVKAAIDSSWSPAIAGRTIRVTADVTAPGVSSDSLVVTIDPKPIGDNKFITRFNADGACATGAGHHCFYTYVTIDAYTSAGRHTLTVTATATDGSGRSATGSAQVDVARADDRDGDGLPDAWEERYGLLNPASGTPAVDGSATGDPDEDGINNLAEFRANSHPRGRYLRAFTEGSYGERQALTTCFNLKALPASERITSAAAVRVRAIGDDGRTSETFFPRMTDNRRVCPLGDWPEAVADRVVAVLIESEQEVVVERISYSRGDDTWKPLNASLGVQSPARQWYFARGGGAERAPLDLYFLAFNPGSEAVEASFTFTGDGSEAPVTWTRTLAPGVRTTIWVNEDVPAAAAFDAATTVTSPEPIYIERAWRHRSPGRSAAHDSVSRGASVTSTWWYFAAGDLSAPFDTSFAAFNPSGQNTTVDATFLFADRGPQSHTLDVPAQARTIIRPRDLGIGGAAVGLILHSRDGAGIVAERTTDGATAEQAWRQSALGVTQAGTEWTFANYQRGGGEIDIVIANPSDTDARVLLRYWPVSAWYDGPYDYHVDVPARRAISVPGSAQEHGWLVVISEPRGSAAPTPIVVERVNYVDVDNVRRARQVSIAGNLSR
jgi:hypothetical protein